MIALKRHQRTLNISQRWSRRVPRISCRGIQTDEAHRPFRILFCGRDEFSVIVFEQLHAASDVWENITVATYPDVKVGRRGSELSVSPLKRAAEKLSCPVDLIPPTKDMFKFWKPPSSFTPSESSQTHMHNLLVTASFGRIIRTPVLNLFHHTRRLNVHPSLLPAYRGPAPIQHSLLRGDKETGVCVIEMTPFKQGIDSGAIYGKKTVAVPESAAFPTLRTTLALEGGQLLVSVLRDMAAGKSACVPQEVDSSSPRAPAISAGDASVNFAVMTSEDIVRRYRAISHQKPLTAVLSNSNRVQLHMPSASRTQEVVIAHHPLPIPGAACFHRPTASILIRCASDTVISIPQLHEQGRNLLSARDWFNGVVSRNLVDSYGNFKFRVLEGEI